MDEPSPSLKVCPACGADRVTNESVLWPELDQQDVVFTVGYALYDEAGILLYWSAETDVAENLWLRLTRGRNVLRSQIPPRVLNQGKYRLELIVALYHRQCLVQRMVASFRQMQSSVVNKRAR
jgi:lipopolysaccharide transport system ATP-binding protein